MLLILCLLVQRDRAVKPDHVRVSLHLVKSRMYWNVKSIVEGIAKRIIDKSLLHGSDYSSLRFAEGLSDALKPGGATPVPDRDPCKLSEVYDG